MQFRVRLIIGFTSKFKFQSGLQRTGLTDLVQGAEAAPRPFSLNPVPERVRRNAKSTLRRKAPRRVDKPQLTALGREVGTVENVESLNPYLDAQLICEAKTSPKREIGLK